MRSFGSVVMIVQVSSVSLRWVSSVPTVRRRRKVDYFAGRPTSVASQAPVFTLHRTQLLDETATFLGGRPKRGFLCNRLSLRIDTLITDLDIFCPRWNQAPPKLNEFAYCGIGVNSDGHNRLSWRDIVAGPKE